MSHVISFPITSSPFLWATKHVTAHLASAQIVKSIEDSFFDDDSNADLEARYDSALQYLNDLMDELAIVYLG